MLNEAVPDSAAGPDRVGSPSVAPRRARAFLIAGALLFGISVAGYAAEVLGHPLKQMLTWYDLRVFLDSGAHARYHPSELYTWQLSSSVRFVYTPFAALVFAAASGFPLAAVRAAMTIASFLAIPLTVWLTLGGMGRRGVPRLAAALTVSALAIWIYPVIWSLHLGQVEPLLMLIVVWDLTQPDGRWWKGAGVGVAAGIKLVPLIFIPYLLLAGKIRQALVATGAFAVTIAIGFIAQPGQSHKWWLTGYFLQTGKNGSVDGLVNQSLLAVLARHYSGAAAARPVWLPIAVVVAIVGLAAAALLNRAGLPVQGMLLCALLGLLLSPISWDNHWVWIAPVMAMLAGLAMTARHYARWAYLAGIAALVVVFGAWPWYSSGPSAFVPEAGLLGWFATRTQPVTPAEISSLHGAQLITWNLYVLAGLVIVLSLLVPAWGACRRRLRSEATAA
jgi:alpha-1,2-mannosyltransferase